MVVLNWSDQVTRTGLVTKPRVARVVTKIFVCLLFVGVWHQAGASADPPTAGQALETRIQGLIPDLERYVTSGMKAFDVPGLAIGLVANDKLVYAKGFGVRRKEVGGVVDTRTVFQIGSTTKGFLATTLAMMVDRGRLKWDERVIDALIVEIQATGAQFKLEPWDGDIFAVRLVPSGRFAAVAKNLGDEPNGLAQFQSDAGGKPAVLRITLDDGQAYDFRREAK